MLRIRLTLQDVVRAKDSPSVSSLTLAGVTPGSCYDLIKVTPVNDTFYLYIPAAHGEKPARSTPALLPARHPRPEQWKQAANHLLAYEPPPNAQFQETILHMIAYETVSDPTPAVGGQAPHHAADEKPLGELERYALDNHPDLITCPDEQSALNKLGFDTLATVRIGHARIAILELAQHVLEHVSTQSGKSTTVDPPIMLTLPLLDVTDSPMQRGSVLLEVTPEVGLIVNDDPGIGITPVPYAGTNVLEKLRTQVPEFTSDSYTRLIEQSRRIVYQEFVNAYVRAFPPLPSERARNQGADLGEASVSTTTAEDELDATGARPTKGKSNIGYQVVEKAIANELITLNGRLGAAAESVVTMHAPIVSINGDVHVPIGYYYKSPINPGFITTHHHQRYFGSILETVCNLFGTTSAAFAAEVHRELDGGREVTRKGARREPTPSILACVRILGFFLTHLNTTFRYRADFALGKGKAGSKSALQIREDTSQDLLMGMNSEDCDGMENAVHAVCFIIWTGVQTLTNPHLKTDRIFEAIQAAIAPTKRFGGWEDEGLNAVQRLLFYYTPMSLVGATTASFPESASTASQSTSGQESVNVLAAHGIKTMTGLTRDSPGEAKKFYTKINEIDELECHRWGLLVPFQTIVSSLNICFDAEDGDGTVRSASDQSVVDRLRKLHSSISEIGWFLPVVPPVLLEGTVPTNPFAMFGGSAWLGGEGGVVGAEIRTAEQQQRDLSLHNKADDLENGAIVPEDTWYPRGVITVDEGSGQWLQGDDPTRLTSLFYKMATCADIPIFNELFDTTDFTCAFVTEDCKEFGVDIETVMGRHPAKYGLMMSLHRIPTQLRKEAKQIADQTVKWRLPAQFGAYPGLNIQLPTPLAGNAPASLNPSGVFERTLAIVNLNITSPEHVAELEEILHDHNPGGFVRIEEKLQPYGPRIAIYSFGVTGATDNEGEGLETERVD